MEHIRQTEGQCTVGNLIEKKEESANGQAPQTSAPQIYIIFLKKRCILDGEWAETSRKSFDAAASGC